MENTVLVIMDGIGHSTTPAGNAVAVADMKTHKQIIANGVSTLINASGTEVGLLEGASGNSEVGHNAIGSGQHIKQGLSLLNEQIENGDIFKMPTFLHLVENAKQEGHKFNLIILLSDGNVHSSINHLFAFMKKISEMDNKILISIHALLDGRDVHPQSALKYIKQTWDFIAKNKINATLSTASGRNTILMDRYESDTSKVVAGFKAVVNGVGIETDNIENSLNEYYSKNAGATDENTPAYILDKKGLIQNGDSILLLNYRGDRAVEMCQMFDRGKYISTAEFKQIENCKFAGILLYDAEKLCPQNYVSLTPNINNTLTEFLCEHNIKQYTVTESQKFGHLTYFFNGNTTKIFNSELECYEEIKSDKVIFSEKPKMKANEIANKVVNAIKSGEYNFIKCNFANGDMVGHTGNFSATVTACKAVDRGLEKIYKACKKFNFNLIVIADHGNAEKMLDEKNNIVTSHTNNPVWFSAINNNGKKFELNAGNFGLTNIASSVATSLGIEPNPVWEKSIIK